MTKTDILQEIKDDDLPALLALFKNDWPKLIEPYLCINNFIQWKQKNPAVKVEFLCPNGKWDDGTFIVIAKEGIHTMYMYTLDKSCDRLAAGLKNTRRIDWKKHLLIYSIHESFVSKICPILKSIAPAIIYHDNMYIWHLPKQIATNFNPTCPDDCYFDTLSPKNAVGISENWHIKAPGLEDYIRNIIAMNLSVGLFAKDDDELRCSALVTDMGIPGALQVPEKYRQMGYAKVLIEHIAPLITKYTELLATTSQSNHFLNTYYHKLGGKILNTSQLFFFAPITSKL